MFRLYLTAGMAAACILAGTSATPTEPPQPPTTTLTEEDSDTPMPTDTPESPTNTTKEKGTNRVLNYGVVAGGAFGVHEYHDDYFPGYPHPPPPPPFLPAQGPVLPGHVQPPLPPFPGAFLATGSCKYYCPGRWHNQVYCCDNTPSFTGFRCPRVRDTCPGKHYFRHVRFCSQDRACLFGELCCLDACIGRHVCKTPERR